MNTEAGQTKQANRGIRLKYQGKQADLIETRKTGKKKQQTQEHKRLRAAAKASSRPENSNSQAVAVDTAPAMPTIAAPLQSDQALAATATIAPEPVAVTQNPIAPTASADDTPSIAPSVEPGNVIDIQKRLQEKNQVEFFEEQLKLAEEQRPNLVVPRRTRRFR